MHASQQLWFILLFRLKNSCTSFTCCRDSSALCIVHHLTTRERENKTHAGITDSFTCQWTDSKYARLLFEFVLNYLCFATRWWTVEFMQNIESIFISSSSPSIECKWNSLFFVYFFHINLTDETEEFVSLGIRPSVRCFHSFQTSSRPRSMKLLDVILVILLGACSLRIP